VKVNASLASVATAGLPRLVTLLEDGGCDGLFVAEINQDPLMALASTAPFTTSLTLGTSVALAFPRGPTTLAYAAHYLNEASDGRFVLGLGAQVAAHMTRRFGLAPRPAAAAMRELILAWHAVWDSWESERPLRFEGTYYRLSLMPSAFVPRPSTRPRPKVFLAAVGPRMAEVAGEVADGIMVHALATPRYVESVVRPALESGLAKSGRRRSDIEIYYSAFVAHGGTDREVACRREAVRAQLAFYASTPAYKGVLDCHGYGDLQPVLHRASVAGRWDQMARDIPDELVDLFCVAGSPADVAGTVARRWGTTLDQVSLPADLWSCSAPDDPEWRSAVAALRRTPGPVG
jgi:probable F420-dependent oxidoreductase